MTDQEKKAWEDIVEWLKPKIGVGGSFEFLMKGDGEAILAADSELTLLRSENEGLIRTNNHLHAELKRLRETVEWACCYGAALIVDDDSWEMFCAELRLRAVREDEQMSMATKGLRACHEAQESMREGKK